jgi:hypothetical protein
MNFLIKNRSEISRENWDKAVEASADEGYYFARSAWLDGINAIKQWGFIDYSFAVYSNNRIYALVPLQWDEKNRCLLSTAWGLTAPIFVDKSKRLHHFVYEYIDELAKYLKVNSVKLGMHGCFEANNKESSKGINPWVAFGFNDISSHTQVISFQNKSIDNLWMGLSQTARHTIKKAENNGYVEIVDWKDRLDHYYHLHKLTYQKSNLNPHPYEYFKMISNLSKDNHKLFAFSNKEGNVLAYHNDLHYQNTACYHTAASSEEGNALGAHYLLTWHAINFAQRTDCRFYEVGEVIFDDKYQKAKQISLFKSRFGGDLNRLYRAEKKYTHNPKKDAFFELLRSAKKLSMELINIK